MQELLLLPTALLILLGVYSAIDDTIKQHKNYK